MKDFVKSVKNKVVFKNPESKFIRISKGKLNAGIFRNSLDSENDER